MFKHPITAVCAMAALLGTGAGALAIEVPKTLEPPAGETLAMVVPAKGVQIYTCKATPARGHEWTFVAPDAKLFDRSGNAIGRHDAGPRWLAADGSSIVGTVGQRADAPASGAVAWLLMSARATGPAGAFSPITSIQRLNTVGGVAPRSGCSPDTIGAVARVPYTAEYHFYRSKT